MKTHTDKDIISLVGKTIKSVRHMDKTEIDGMLWYDEDIDTTVIEFTDNTYAIVSQDPEGNGAGHLFVGSYK